MTSNTFLSAPHKFISLLAVLAMFAVSAGYVPAFPVADAGAATSVSVTQGTFAGFKKASQYWNHPSRVPCSGLSQNRMTAYLLTPVPGEAGNFPDPMVFSRGDFNGNGTSGNVNNYSFNTVSGEERAFYHSGVGPIQIDFVDSGLSVPGKNFEEYRYSQAGRMNTVKAGEIALAVILKGFCQGQDGYTGHNGAMRVLYNRWGACGRYDSPPVPFFSSPCWQTFNSIYNSSNNSLILANINRDTSAGGYMGGVKQRACRITSTNIVTWDATATPPPNNFPVNSSFLCFWVNEDNAVGNMFDQQPWTGGSSVSPYAAPYISFRQGNTQFNIWPQTSSAGITTPITKWVSGTQSTRNGRDSGAGLSGWHRGQRAVQVQQCPYDPVVSMPVCSWTSTLANADY